MIKVIEGNILNAEENIIVQQVNCMAVMGSGLAKQIRDKYPIVFEEYKEFCKVNKGTLMGKVNFVEIEENKYVANIFGQYDYGTKRVHTDYESLKDGLELIHDTAEESGLSVAIPYKLGCGLAGGNWNIVLGIINNYFEHSKVKCVIYQLEE